MLQLTIEQGQPIGQTWPLNPGLTSVGRSANNDIILSGSQVSRVHFVVEMVGPDQFALTDKSTNGTLVNGRRAQDRTPLKAGDRIQVGEVVLRCEEAAVGAVAWQAASPAPAAWAAPMPEPAAWPAPAPAPTPVRRSTSNIIPIAIGVIAAIVILTAVIAAPVFLSGRGSATPSSSATPTTTVVASAPMSPTVGITATATLTMTAVVTPTLAPAPTTTVAGRVKAGQGLNVRAQPGTAGQRLYTLGQQAAITAIGRNDAGDWYLIQCQPGQPVDQKCWVFAELVEWDQSGDQLPVVQP